MSLKIYRCLYRKYSIPVLVKDKEIRVTFEGGIRMGNYEAGGSFITKDTALQKAIESTVSFKSGNIWVEKDMKKKKVSSTEIKKKEDTENDGRERVKNQQEAEEFLRNKGMEIQPGSLSVEEVVGLAKSEDFSFPAWAAFQK